MSPTYRYHSITYILWCQLLAGLLINYALPALMGEVMGGWLLKREDNTPIVTGLTASTLARLIGLFTAAIGSILLWGVVI